MYCICFFTTSVGQFLGGLVGSNHHAFYWISAVKREDSERRPYARNAHNRRDVSPFVPQNNSGRNYVNWRWKHYSTSTKIALKIEHPPARTKGKMKGLRSDKSVFSWIRNKKDCARRSRAGIFCIPSEFASRQTYRGLSGPFWQIAAGEKH